MSSSGDAEATSEKYFSKENCNPGNIPFNEQCELLRNFIVQKRFFVLRVAKVSARENGA
jgi:hypothetical protein